jgi:hypothetical protein
VTVLVAERLSHTQDGTVYMNIKARAQIEIELKDFDDYQPLPLPPFKLAANEENLSFVAIKILSVYPGSKYHDTLISEINNP